MSKAERSRDSRLPPSPPPPNSGDCFSKLPDELLVSIFSCMSFHEAARMGRVSRRFQALWPFSTGGIAFRKSFYMTTEKFVGLVNQALRSHKGLTMEGFILRIDELRQLGRAFNQREIDAWIEEALCKSVRKLHLRVLPIYVDGQPKYYLSRGSIFPFIKNSRGSSYIRSLTSVSLYRMGVNEDFIEYLLTSCPLLEDLEVHESIRLPTITINNATLKLRTLHMWGSFTSFVIERAPNLQSFTYGCQLPVLNIISAPKLRHLSVFQQTDGLLPSYCCLEGLQTLRIYLCLGTVSILDCMNFPAMPCLLHMTWKLQWLTSPSILHTVPLFKACPLLQKFTIEVPNGEPSGEKMINDTPVPPVPHKHLKEIELVGFIGHDVIMDLATYLIEAAITLERVVVQGRPIGCYHDDCLVSSSDLRLLSGSIAMGVQELKKKLPPNVTLVVNNYI